MIRTSISDGETPIY